MTLIFGIVLFGLVFEYTNGFHDTSQRHRHGRFHARAGTAAGIMMAASATAGRIDRHAVACTIGKGLVDTESCGRRWCSCVAGRRRLESAHLVAGPARFQSRLDRRPVRSDFGRGGRHVERDPLAGAQRERLEGLLPK